MIEVIFWMAAGAAFYHFFPKIAVGIYRRTRDFLSSLNLPF